MGIRTALLWRGAGYKNGARVDAFLSQFLHQRGVDVQWTHCDAALDGCTFRTVQDHPNFSTWAAACDECQANNRQFADSAGVTLVPLSTLRPEQGPTSPNASDEIHVEAAAIRYLQAEPRLDEGDAELLARYRTSAAVTRAAAEQAATSPPDLVLMSHGIYVDWGPAFDVFRTTGARLVRWAFGYLPGHIYVREDDADNPHHMYYLSDENWQEIAAAPLTDAQQSALAGRVDAMELLNRERQARHLHAEAGEAPTPGQAPDLSQLVDDPAEIASLLDLDLSKKTWVLFPHLNWDAHHSFEDQLHHDAAGWLLGTITAAAQDPDVQWLVKAHPSEHRLGTRHGSENIIRAHLGDLPSNVRIIPSDSPICTYGLLRFISGVVTQRGTIGIEATCRGLPAILGGEAHYGEKGFTLEPATEAEYSATIAGAGSLGRLTAEQQALAQRYAHDFWVRRQLEVTNRTINGRDLTDADAEAAETTHAALARILLGQT